mmetsp:Transcript_7482/g.19651  ORF Transcript_7482/g.19651 Transcript_7482/m.19651 type:complete len:222 (-) Transcript_7482:15-680(-)
MRRACARPLGTSRAPSAWSHRSASARAAAAAHPSRRHRLWCRPTQRQPSSCCWVEALDWSSMVFGHGGAGTAVARVLDGRGMTGRGGGRSARRPRVAASRMLGATGWASGQRSYTHSGAIHGMGNGGHLHSVTGAPRQATRWQLRGAKDAQYSRDPPPRTALVPSRERASLVVESRLLSLFAWRRVGCARTAKANPCWGVARVMMTMSSREGQGAEEEGER